MKAQFEVVGEACPPTVDELVVLFRETVEKELHGHLDDLLWNNGIATQERFVKLLSARIRFFMQDTKLRSMTP
jgi:hypothetical protein